MIVPESALALARIADAAVIARLSRTLIETGLPWSWVPRHDHGLPRSPAKWIRQHYTRWVFRR